MNTLTYKLSYDTEMTTQNIPPPQHPNFPNTTQFIWITFSV